MMQRRVHERVSLDTLTEHRQYTINALSFDYQWWMAKNGWRSVDAHLHDGAGKVPQSLFPIMAANTMIMHSNNQIACELPDLQDQKLMTLCGRSYSEWGLECVATSFAHKDSQYHIYEWPQPIATQITNDARSTIVDTLLTILFRMRQGAYGSLFCLKGQPIPHWWMAATDRHSDYQWCKTNNRWHSVDAQIQNGAVSVWLSLLHTNPANITLMIGRKWSPSRLRMMQYLKSLTLHWHSFSHGCIHNTVSFDLAKYIIDGVLAAFVPSSCTFSFITTMVFNNTYEYII